ncbi:MAG: CopG family ribbon-helix-helix protein [Candidatus Njordarchaeia archaeon]
MKTRKTGISIPQDVLDRLDNVISKIGVRSRSKAITEAIISYIEEKEALLSGEDKEVVSIIFFVYNHEIGDTVKAIIDIQHHHLSTVIVNSHIHLSKERCLEIIIAKAKLREIAKIVSEIEDLRGVEYVKATKVPI